MSAFRAFLEQPSEATFREVRAGVILSPSYAPYSDEMERAQEAMQTGDLDSAHALLQAGMPNLLLSPKAHLMLAWIASRREQVQVTEAETWIAQACLDGLLASGDGSQERPYAVLRISDEYDLLKHLGRKPQNQALVQHEGRSLDRVECTDDSVHHFDVTEAQAAFQAGFSPT